MCVHSCKMEQGQDPCRVVEKGKGKKRKCLLARDGKEKREEEALTAKRKSGGGKVVGWMHGWMVWKTV